MTRDELELLLTRRLLPKYQREITLGDWLTQAQASSSEFRDRFLEALRTGKEGELGKGVVTIRDDWAGAQAAAEAATMAADDSLDLTEITRAFGR